MAIFFQGTWATPNDANGVKAVWRALTWKEFRGLTQKYSHVNLSQTYPMELYMEIYELILVAGPHPSLATAGMVANVALQQIKNNPFADYKAMTEKLQQKRNWVASDFLQGVRAVISATFHIPFETMDSWDPETLFEKFALAEHAVGAQWNPADPRQIEIDARAAAEALARGPQRREPQSQREVAWLNAQRRTKQRDAEEAMASGQSAPQAPKDESFSWSR